MKTLIQIVLVSLIVGGMSAGGSFYWHQKFTKAATPDHDATMALHGKSESKETSEKKASEDSAGSKDNADEEGLAISDVVASTVTDESKTEHADSAVDLKEFESTPLPFGPPAGVRPPWNQTGDEAGDLINILRARAAATSRQERRLAEREDAMNLIAEDLRLEQANSAKIRERLIDESNRAVRAAEKARRDTTAERAAIYRATEMERAKIREEQIEERRIASEQMENLRREKEEAIQSVENALKVARQEQEEMKKHLDRSGSPEETANLKNLNSVMESMPVEGSAKVLQDFAHKGRTEAVVLILNGMKPKKAAKVLSLIQESDAPLATELVDRLKRYKSEGSTSDAAK